MMRFASLSVVIGLLVLAACEGPAETTQLVVDPDQCIACGKCEEVCPYGAIEVIDGNAVIDPNLCHFCYRCVEICPEGAIY